MKREDVLNKGKAILHATKSIKNNHISEQIGLFQQTLRIKLEDRFIDGRVNDIKLFKEGIEMTGSKLNKELKKNIIEYCDMSIEFYENKED